MSIIAVSRIVIFCWPLLAFLIVQILKKLLIYNPSCVAYLRYKHKEKTTTHGDSSLQSQHFWGWGRSSTHNSSLAWVRPCPVHEHFTYPWRMQCGQPAQLALPRRTLIMPLAVCSTSESFRNPQTYGWQVGSVNHVQRTRSRHGSKENEANHSPEESPELLICTCSLFSFLAYNGWGLRIW